MTTSSNQAVAVLDGSDEGDNYGPKPATVSVFEGSTEVAITERRVVTGIRSEIRGGPTRNTDGSVGLALYQEEELSCGADPRVYIVDMDDVVSHGDADAIIEECL